MPNHEGRNHNPEIGRQPVAAPDPAARISGAPFVIRAAFLCVCTLAVCSCGGPVKAREARYFATGQRDT